MNLIMAEKTNINAKDNNILESTKASKEDIDNDIFFHEQKHCFITEF